MDHLRMRANKCRYKEKEQFITGISDDVITEIHSGPDILIFLNAKNFLNICRNSK